MSTSFCNRLPAFPFKPRVFILSDIENEPDDQQSLVRYLLYCNEFDTRGICAVTSAWLSDRTAPESMLNIIAAYSAVVDNLNKHVHPSAQYPSAESLSRIVSSGATVREPSRFSLGFKQYINNTASKVYGKQALALPLSEGARNLVNSIEESSKPLWVISWGGTNVLAEALQYIRETKPPVEETALHARLRVHTISDQDDTGDWIRSYFPNVFYICSVHGFGAFDMSAWQGISHPISRGDLSKTSIEWLAANVQKGPLGAAYPTSLHIMEGDTPTFLYLIQNGLGSPEWPNFGGWGGRYRAVNVGSAHYADVVDVIIDVDGSARTDNKATIARWRDHFQNDVATRMSWSLTPDFGNASHPPVPIVNDHQGPEFLLIKVKSGDTIILDASKSLDPDRPEDNSQLDYQWYQYNEPTLNHPIGAQAVPRCNLRPLLPPSGAEGYLAYNDCGFEDVALGPKIAVKVPDSKAPGIMNYPAQHWLPHTGIEGMSYHIIAQVSNKNTEFPVRRYLRVILDAGLS